MIHCKVDGCFGDSKGKRASRGFCFQCYNKWRKGKLPGWEVPEDEQCPAPGCKAPGLVEDHCRRHYREWLQNDKDPDYWKGRVVHRTCRSKTCNNILSRDDYTSYDPTSKTNWLRGLCVKCRLILQDQDPKTAGITAPQLLETVCKVPGCENDHKAMGFCARHHRRWKRGRLPDFDENGDPIVGNSTEP